MPVIRIDRIDDPQLDDYRNIPDGELLRRRKRFVGEGRLVVRRLLGSAHAVVSLLLNEPSFQSLERELAGVLDKFPVYLCSSAALAEIVGFNFHRGCLALAELPPERTAADVMHAATRLLVLEGVTDADNVGSAFRNAAAFGVDGVLVSSCCDPLYRKAVRTSMGAVLQIPYARLSNWPHDTEMLRSAGFTLVALTPSEHAVDISQFTRRTPRLEKIALLVGSEASGLSADVESLADVCVRIAMRPGVDSLNLATATGIALHQLTS